MKTLDEVIKAFEICRLSVSPFDEMCKQCPYYDEDENGKWLGSYCGDCHTDALHYLLEYRTEQKILSDSKEHYEYWEHKYYDELEKNDPLTWDELKQMEGKPVWVEYFGANRWIIPQEFRFDIAGREYLLAQDGGMIFRFQQHDVWQAYRKERG